MDDEALSWFVDDTVAQALLAVRGVGAVDARRRRDARDPGRARPGAPAGARRDRRRHLAPAAPGAAAKRRADAPTSAAPSSRCARSPPCRPRRARAHGDRARATAARIRLDQVATVSDTVAERARRRCSNGKPVVGFEIVAQHAAPARSTSRAACEPRSQTLEAEHPDIEHQPRRSTSSTRSQRELPRLDGAAVRRRDRSRCWWSGCSCATGARRWSRADGAAAVDHPDVLRRCHCSASRSTS